MDDDLDQLAITGLVSRVRAEINNYTGVSDETLAEFIIFQRLEAAKESGGDATAIFKSKLQALGADFPPSLIDSVDRLCMLLHPKLKGKKTKEPLSSGQPRPSETKPKAAAFDDSSLDDTLAQLESLAGNGPAKRIRSKSRSRSRSRSPGKRRKRRDHREQGRDRDQDGNRHRARYRSRSASDPPKKRDRGRGDRGDRERDRELDDAPLVNKIYDGKVTGIKDFGAFVSLYGVKGKCDGLVHVSRLTEGRRIGHPSDIVEQGDSVKVKVISVEGNRISLSMKDVDQVTGDDLTPSVGSGANSEALGGSRNGFAVPARPNQARQRRPLTDNDIWEIRQLIKSGVAKASDFPELNEGRGGPNDDDGLEPKTMELEEDVDIEMREDRPEFLTKYETDVFQLSPIRVVKAPDGSMNRAATVGSELIKDRKEAQRQAAEEAASHVVSNTDLSAQWNDPMANPDQRTFASELRKVRMNAKTDAVPEWKRALEPKDHSYGKRTSLSIKEQRESLPVFAFRSQLISAVKENQILIVVGETGSGKTTQLTQYLAEAGFANDAVIGCTQPRRVAAMSVAKRVAEEVGCKLGEEVGYTIRFEDCTSPSTRIKYMTDGMLQREILMDSNLKRYSVIMLDEAHERTIATDVLFALLKKTLKRRPDMRVIVTSATLDADKFSTYFNECPIFTIPGRTYPVEILYSKEPESDYLEAALMTVMQIHLTEPKGDVLLFLTGQEEIDTSCEILHERMKALGSDIPELHIIPVYSALPSEMQSRVFDPAPEGSRKLIVATNIAETSITVDGIHYVVDPGFVKQNAYDPKLGMDSLVVVPISQAQANQRAGRAGRTGPGKCFRLYTEAAYNSEMLPTTIPEIQRQNLAHTILMLKAMGIDDLLNFDFMDPPPVKTMLTALEELYALSALDDEGLLTRLGRKMSGFPMQPSLAKVLIAAVDMECSDEMLTIVAMLSVPQVFYRPKEKQDHADKKKSKFHDPHGDHLTFLNVYNAWKRNGHSSAWCFENFIQYRSMRRARDVRDQLIKIMERYRHPVVSCGRDTQKVRQALCAGYFRNAARKDPQEGYKTLIEGTPVYLHPSSALFGKQAEWVIYDTLIMTTKEYMQCTTTIEPKWLVDAAPTFFKVAPTDRLSKRKQAERIQPLFNKFQGEDDWRLSAQRRGGRSGGGGGTWG